MTRRQCAKCPWKVSTNPHEIPGDYSVAKHLALQNTIAEPGALHFPKQLRLMACHESPAGEERVCVGWLDNQLHSGNNLALRLAAVRGHVDLDYEVVGEQHTRFEDTLPPEVRSLLKPRCT